ncbi:MULTISPECIES: hypothetical protein [unclassified Minwuia]|uniref:c-type cytochrome n=1 Tax=unclassified Minwuia TaxID=2618799 RepID=UPI0024799468|nr:MULTISPECIES: hypothetical protein [unclassified Minwuia]
MLALRRTANAGVSALCLMASGAVAGDAAYGEYLSGECVACHQKSGADDGIPSIVGWDAVSFVAVMLSYKQGGRDSEVMVNVAQSLDLEQIEALAAHFATIEHQEE